jgi:hypothetical protein
MEDYRMNGPRLLSRNGLSVSDDDDDDYGESEENKEKDDTTTTKDEQLVDGTESKAQTERKMKNILTTTDADVKNITKYLWDDPGDTAGIATIRIDVLPTNLPGEYLDIKDCEIEDVQASLAGEGLLVRISVAEHGKFQLKISKLYGDATDVKVIVKPKRLLVKIRKKKNSFLSSLTASKSNLDSWPQPHRKV